MKIKKIKLTNFSFEHAIINFKSSKFKNQSSKSLIAIQNFKVLNFITIFQLWLAMKILRLKIYFKNIIFNPNFNLSCSYLKK